MLSEASRQMMVEVERAAGLAAARALEDLLCALYVTGERPLKLAASARMADALMAALAAIPARAAPVTRLDGDLRPGEVLLAVFDQPDPRLDALFAHRAELPLLRLAVAGDPALLPAGADIAAALPALERTLPRALHALADARPRSGLRPAVFIDRDGVICENREDYVRSLDDFALLPDVTAPLRRLADSGRAVMVVSNQSALGRGLTTPEAVEAINRYMLAAVEAGGGRMDAVYICPHAPWEHCNCRKPRPALLMRAACEHGLDLSRSYMVGDAVSDVQAGLAAGCKPLMVLTGRGQTQLPALRAGGYGRVPVVADLSAAVAGLLGE
jgi:D-glycero-D-manno-heptose 1,7-bisphosphate phosphatase